MLNLSNLRVPLAGAAIAAAAFSTTAALEAHPVEKEAPGTVRVDHARNLNVPNGVEQFRGKLSGSLAPQYDGPVLWAHQTSPGDMAAIGGGLGLVGGIVVGLIITSQTDRFRYVPLGALAGATIIGGLCYLNSDVQKIEFNTKVAAVMVSNQPHTEMVRSGKTETEQGPFFGQILSIPETDLALAANAKGAPMLPGQNIKATFWVNGDGQIMSWSAQPGPRAH